MTKKKILNWTSRKKRDTLLQYSNTLATTGASQTIAQGAAVVAGGSTALFVFSPTCRDLTIGSDVNPDFDNTRTSSTVYNVGFKERLRYESSSSKPWLHRRICFTSRSKIWRTPYTSTTGATQARSPYYEIGGGTAVGFTRLWANMSVNNEASPIATIYEDIFQGKKDKDWSDVISAKFDTSYYDLKFDRTWILKPNNGSTILSNRSLYHPMNQNMVYDDEEDGGLQGESFFASNSRVGMGDYLVVDIFQPHAAAAATDLLKITSSSVMYWHEK